MLLTAYTVVGGLLEGVDAGLAGLAVLRAGAAAAAHGANDLAIPLVFSGTFAERGLDAPAKHRAEPPDAESDNLRLAPP